MNQRQQLREHADRFLAGTDEFAASVVEDVVALDGGENLDLLFDDELVVVEHGEWAPGGVKETDGRRLRL